MDVDRAPRRSIGSGCLRRRICRFRPTIGNRDFVVADPGPLGLFLNPIYDRGAATLHALRVKIGDAAFFELAQTWVERFGGGTASTADFIALSQEVSGQDLAAFFDVWLYTPEKPVAW